MLTSIYGHSQLKQVEGGYYDARVADYLMFGQLYSDTASNLIDILQYQYESCYTLQKDSYCQYKGFFEIESVVKRGKFYIIDAKISSTTNYIRCAMDFNSLKCIVLCYGWRLTKPIYANLSKYYILNREYISSMTEKDRKLDFLNTVKPVESTLCLLDKGSKVELACTDSIKMSVGQVSGLKAANELKVILLWNKDMYILGGMIKYNSSYVLIDSTEQSVLTIFPMKSDLKFRGDLKLSE